MLCSAQVVVTAILSLARPILAPYVQPPAADADGRWQTLNHHGFDSRPNETQVAFMDHAVKQSHSSAKNHKLNFVLDVGAGFGRLGGEVVRRGGNYAYLDMDPDQATIAWDVLQKASIQRSQYRILCGRIPQFSGSKRARQLHFDLYKLKKDTNLTAIGMFSVSMYLSGPEFFQTLSWAYQYLPSGGRLYLTAISPFSNLFRGYEEEYLRRRGIFERTQGVLEPFPGWVDTEAPHMQKYLPRGYAKNYPRYFHLFDPFVINFYAQRVGFKIAEGKDFRGLEFGYLSRRNPSNLAYRGPIRFDKGYDVGELASVILEKP